jgi:hypothetical protein
MNGATQLLLRPKSPLPFAFADTDDLRT